MVSGGRLATLLHPFAVGRPPVEYLNGTFGLFEEEYRSDYRRLFGLLTTQFPSLKILCHGYDHAIPKNGTWLGRPMFSIGIHDPALQRAIIQVVIDRMNSIVEQVADEFTRVTYLDVRNIVSPQGWFDELHPHSRPFGDIASVFIEAIRSGTS